MFTKADTADNQNNRSNRLVITAELLQNESKTSEVHSFNLKKSHEANSTSMLVHVNKSYLSEYKFNNYKYKNKAGISRIKKLNISNTRQTSDTNQCGMLQNDCLIILLNIGAKSFS